MKASRFKRRGKRGLVALLVALLMSFLMLMVSVSSLTILRTQIRFNFYQYLMAQSPYTSESAIVELVSSKADAAFIDLYSVDFYTGDLTIDPQHYVGKYNWDSTSSYFQSITDYRYLSSELYLRIGWQGDSFTDWDPEKLSRAWGL